MVSAASSPMEQLTPELERRLQVEELWARRTVLADSMNAQRRERFRAQHSLLTRFGTSSLRLAAKSEAPQILPADTAPAAVVAPGSPGAAQRRWSWGPAMAALLGLFALLGASAPGLIAQARDRLAVVMVPAEAPTPHTVAAKSGGPIDIQAEVAARIAAALGSEPHTRETLRALQSDPQAFDQAHAAP